MEGRIGGSKYVWNELMCPIGNTLFGATAQKRASVMALIIWAVSMITTQSQTSSGNLILLL